MVDADEFIQFAMDDLECDNQKDKIENLQLTKTILRNELLVCYEYLESKGLMDDYKAYRG